MDKVNADRTGEAVAKTASIPVSGDTRRRVIEAVERINKKERGRKIKPDEVVAALIDHLDTELEKKIQRASYSPLDIMEMGHEEYVAAHGSIPYNVFLVRVVNGSIPKPKDWPSDVK